MKASTLFFLSRYSAIKPWAFNTYKNSLKADSMSREELDRMNWERTKQLLEYAYQFVPYYKNKFERIGLNPADISSEEYYNQVPILTKNDVLENYQDLISSECKINNLKEITTGGSTGVPLKVGKDKRVVREAQKWRIQSWWGIDPTDNIATVYRPLPYSRLEKMAYKFVYWPQKNIQLDATNFDEKDINNFIEQINLYRPKMIHGYVGAVDIIADYINENDIQVHNPETVWLTAAPITAIQEEKISRAFNAPVCDQYGCSEIYFISAECKHKKGLHILSDIRKVECLNGNERSTSGKLVITDLEDYSFPLIRYMNGDEGSLLKESCSCGLQLPLMDKVKGRITDNLKIAEGIVISGEYLTTIFDDYVELVNQFQVIQKKEDLIVIKVVPKKTEGIDHLKDSILNELRKKTKGKSIIEFLVVESIPMKNGKLQYIVKEF